MDNKTSDESVKKALDDIFGSDFIEIDIKDEDNHNTSLDNNIKYLDDNLFFDTNEKENIAKDDEVSNQDIIFESENSILSNQNGVDDSIILSNEEDKNTESKNDASFIKKENKKSRKKSPYIFLIIGLVIFIVLGVIIFISSNRKEKVSICYFKAEDTGYQIIDEYRITYIGNKIKNVDGKYLYKANNDEYKNQIEYIKEEKLPVIVNSNGMNGFTYLYEVGDDYFSVNSYLDFTLFDFDIIDKNNSDSNPISYITINSKIDYPTLTKQFENNGYKCTSSR